MIILSNRYDLRSLIPAFETCGQPFGKVGSLRYYTKIFVEQQKGDEGFLVPSLNYYYPILNLVRIMVLGKSYSTFTQASFGDKVSLSGCDDMFKGFKTCWPFDNTQTDLKL